MIENDINLTMKIFGIYAHMQTLVRMRVLYPLIQFRMSKNVAILRAKG